MRANDRLFILGFRVVCISQGFAEEEGRTEEGDETVDCGAACRSKATDDGLVWALVANHLGKIGIA